jgi:isopenicillin-N epimerase
MSAIDTRDDRARADGDLRRHWLLDPEVVFLNHGSFGACPRPVLEAQTELRLRMEREPVRFFTREGPRLLDAARRALADFIGAAPDGLAFVPNATTAINAVLRSFAIQAGDELIVTDQEYNASRNVLEFVAGRCGARVIVAAVPFPPRSPQDVIEAVLGAVTPRTRLALLDHVTSQTATVLPIAELVRELESRNIAVLVDGAHAPGMLPLDLDALGASFYTGNCHKWLCAPKGAAFLWVREDRRESVRPAVISHGANADVPRSERYRVEFDWTGTDDPSAVLAIPVALRFLGTLLPGGWDAVRAHNRALLLAGRRLVADALDHPPLVPEAMLGSMASLRIPAGERFDFAEDDRALPLRLDPLHDRLFREFRIEVPVLRCPAHPGRLLRISAQLYNRIEDYERLADALREIL